MGLDVEDYYRRFGPMVLRRCRRLLRDEAAARDAMHEVFVKLLTHHDRLQDTAPSSLLYRMATNECLNRIRSRARRRETHDDKLLYAIACQGAAEQTGARSVLMRLFGREEESTAVIAVMIVLDGATLEEVAAEVGLSVSGVRKRMRKLKEHLSELEAGTA